MSSSCVTASIIGVIAVAAGLIVALEAFDMSPEALVDQFMREFVLTILFCVAARYLKPGKTQGKSEKTNSQSSLVHLTNSPPATPPGHLKELDDGDRERSRSPKNSEPVGVLSYASVVGSCARAGDFSRAEEWLGKARSTGSADDVSKCYSALADACARSGDYEGAEAWLQSMSAEGLQPDGLAIGSIVDAKAREGNWDDAETWFASVLATGAKPDEKGYSSVVLACARGGNAKKARQWLNRMRKAGHEPQISVYHSLMEVFARKADPANAELILEDLLSNGVKVETMTLNLVMDACAKA